MEMKFRILKHNNDTVFMSTKKDMKSLVYDALSNMEYNCEADEIEFIHDDGSLDYAGTEHKITRIMKSNLIVNRSIGGYLTIYSKSDELFQKHFGDFVDVVVKLEERETEGFWRKAAEMYGKEFDLRDWKHFCDIKLR